MFSMKKTTWFAFILMTLAGLGACAEKTGTSTATAVDSTPTIVLETFEYSTQEPEPTETQVPEGSSEPILPTPTPFKHTIQTNDTLSGIAFQYGVLLDRLIAANPTVNPNFLVPGEELTIPNSEGSIISYPTPTPVNLQVDFQSCLGSLDGGLWCFPTIQNNQSVTVENVSVSLKLIGENSDVVYTQSAVPALNYLSPGERIPAAAYFPPPVPSNYQINAELQTSLTTESPPPPVSLPDPEIEISPDLLSAQIQGTISLPENLEGIQSVWVAAVGYSGETVVGYRKWISSQILAPGAKLPYQFSLYSLGPNLDRVEVQAEFH
jgi:LysM repeat protein